MGSPNSAGARAPSRGWGTFDITLVGINPASACPEIWDGLCSEHEHSLPLRPHEYSGAPRIQWEESPGKTQP